MNARLAVIAHDAGGAEILASHVRRLPPAERARVSLALAGPACAVFARKLGPRLQLQPLEDVIAGAESVLCGTGWQSEFELNGIDLARAAKKRAVAFLDHWVNYRARFERAGRTTLPDEVWVGDAFALLRARDELPEVLAKLVPNPHLADVSDEIAARGKGDGAGALFLSEPVREHALRQHRNARHWGYTEEDALRYFLRHVGALGEPVPRIVVRLHPSEPHGKYDAILAEYRRLPLELSSGGDVLDDILRSRWVVGCNSTAMVLGLLAGRSVVCSIPPGGRPCQLPHSQIIQLQSLVCPR